MRTLVSVPYPCPDGFPSLRRGQFIGPIARSLADAPRRLSPANITLSLAGKHSVRPLAEDDLPLIVITHDETRLLPAFLAHYRGLGITRFLIVDDVSTDGTRELLSAQPDVDLHSSNVRFKFAHRGRLWREMLVARYGTGRWYASVDADEFLVYRGHETTALPDLIRSLTRRGIWHLPAPMLDMYPQGPVSEAVYAGGAEHPPWTVASMFDAAGYELRADEHAWKVEGGVRRRVFGSRAQLMKYPLAYWGRMTNLTKGNHTLSPYWRNYAPFLGVLLHFKFFSDYWSEFRKTVANAQHFASAALYGDMLRQIDDPTRLVLEGPVSARYTGTDDLVRRGFFANLD